MILLMYLVLGQTAVREPKSDEEQTTQPPPAVHASSSVVEKPLPRVESSVSLSTQSSVHKSEDIRPPVADIDALAKELGKLIEPKRELSASSIHSAADILSAPATIGATAPPPPTIAIEVQKSGGEPTPPVLGVGDSSRLNVLRTSEQDQVGQIFLERNFCRVKSHPCFGGGLIFW